MERKGGSLCYSNFLQVMSGMFVITCYLAAAAPPRFLAPPCGPSEWELYDLREDPLEQRNVAAEHPERVKAMADRLAAIRRAP